MNASINTPRFVSTLLLAMAVAFGLPAQEAPKPDTAAATPPATGNPPPASSANATRRSADRLDLDTTVVTGNRELPKVLYIVPWKKAELGDLPAQPFNTLLDEILQPVDRDVFRRELKYFDTVSGADAAPKSDPQR
jgi:hypothetical protein